MEHETGDAGTSLAHRLRFTPGMLAGDVNTPAEIVETYGATGPQHAYGTSLTQARARRGWAVRHGWVGYLEMANIRTDTAGE
jgi:hypothetical protein